MSRPTNKTSPTTAVIATRAAAYAALEGMEPDEPIEDSAAAYAALLGSDAADTASQYSEASEIQSTTSTAILGHESFEYYRTRILKLCDRVWPGDQFTLERIDSGGNHRVIGITRLHRTSNTIPITARKRGEEIDSIEPEKSRYVIRIPRFRSPESCGKLSNDVATSHFLDQNSGIIPTSGCIAYDPTSDNHVGAPFVIQHRILGMSVDLAWLALNQAQRVSLAQQVGAILSDLQRVSYTSAGKLRPDHTLEAPLHEGPDGTPFLQDLGTESSSNDPPSAAKPQKIADFLQGQINRWRAIDHSLHRNRDIGKWNMLSEVVRQMDRIGIFSIPVASSSLPHKRSFSSDKRFEMGYSITHRDMQPRNVLISVVNDQEVKIEGVLGWERAASLPSFVGCRPPDWLWSSSVREAKDELGENDADDPDPLTSENLAIKAAFDDEVGEAFRKYAYKPEYRLARVVVGLAVDGLTGHGGKEELDGHGDIDDTVEVWNALMRKHSEGQVGRDESEKGDRAEGGVERSESAQDGGRRRPSFKQRVKSWFSNKSSSSD